MLGFAWFYSSESGLFNGLRTKKIKKSFPPEALPISSLVDLSSRVLPAGAGKEVA